MIFPRSRLLLAAVLCLSAMPARAQTAGCPIAPEPLPEHLPLIDAPALDERLHLSADNVDLAADGLSRLLGSVSLQQGDKTLSADNVTFDKASQSVKVDAASVFRNRELSIRSGSAQFSLADESGLFSDTEFTLMSQAARGDAQSVRIRRDGIAVLEQVRYTTCARGSDAWYLQAARIRLDHDHGLGTAKNAQLRFFGVPILYAPWFQFPIDDRRRSGLLFPTFGRSDRTGWDLQQPVYLNLGPNYDATLTPRYMSDRGLQTGVGARYLLRKAEGELSYQYLDEDQLTGEARAYGEFHHRARLNRRLGLDVNFAEASDRTYFEDFGTRLDYSAITHLERSARLTYESPAAYTVRLLAQDYQTITSGLPVVDDPFQRLPQITAEALTRNALWDTRLGLGSEYVNFARQGQTVGQRVDLQPYLQFDRDRVGWFARGELSYRYTGYAIDDPQAAYVDNPDGAALPGDYERWLPSLNAEYGLRFERIGAHGALQTLEPQLFYLWTPFTDQDELPIFDSGRPDFDFTQLFARNRFSGTDRVADANHVAFALTTRRLDADTGVARLSASIGQLYRLHAPRVQLPGQIPSEAGATDFLAMLDYRMSEHVGFKVDTQWSPTINQFTRTSTAIDYRRERSYAYAAYRMRNGLLEQTDVLVSTPVYRGLGMLVRWRYSLPEQRSLDSLVGLSYETCCWGVNASYRRYISNTAGNDNTGIYLQLELKGLARIGTGVENLLLPTQVE